VVHTRNSFFHRG